MTTTLSLPSGHTVLLNDADYRLVAHYRWYAKRVHGTYHAVADIGGHRISMHHFLLGKNSNVKAQDNSYIYHLNGNGLDNRRFNLSMVKTAELLRNLRNQPKPILETY